MEQKSMADFEEPEYSDADIKQWIRELFDPNTSREELQRHAMTLAHIRKLEALQALEIFKKSSRGKEVEWIDCAIEECIFGLLSPETDEEEEDYIRVELWRRYEEEMVDLDGRIDAASTRIVQLQVEKMFLQSVQPKVSEGAVALAIRERLQTMDDEIECEENTIEEMKEKMTCLEFLNAEIEKAIRSPFYREYGKQHIGVDMHRSCDYWMDWDGEEEDDDLPF